MFYSGGKFNDTFSDKGLFTYFQGYGGGGDDTLEFGNLGGYGDGGDGNDTIIGGIAGDSISGGHGNNTLTGAGGGDAFIFRIEDSYTRTGEVAPKTVVTDFHRSEGDKIVLPGSYGKDNFELIDNAFKVVDGNTVLQTVHYHTVTQVASLGGTITFLGVTDLSWSDFMFI